MSVYVDSANIPFRNTLMCHMVADSEEELHAMATSLGMERRWHQKPGTHHSHYDIPIAKKAAALRLGAIEVSRRQLALFLRQRRRTLSLDAS